IPGITCKIFTPGTSAGTKTPQQIQTIAKALQGTTDPAARAQALQGLNSADQQALNQVLSGQQSQLQQSQQQLAEQNAQYQQQLQTIANGSDPCATQTSAEANPNSQNAAAGEVANTYACQQKVAQLNQNIADNNAKMAANQQQLQNLAAAQVALNPNNNP